MRASAETYNITRAVRHSIAIEYVNGRNYCLMAIGDQPKNRLPVSFKIEIFFTYQLLFMQEGVTIVFEFNLIKL